MMQKTMRSMVMLAFTLLFSGCLLSEQEEPSGFSEGERTLLFISLLPAYWMETGCPASEVPYLETGKAYSHSFSTLNEYYWFTFRDAGGRIYTFSYNELPGQEIQFDLFQCGFGESNGSSRRGDSGSPGMSETIELLDIKNPNSFPRNLGRVYVTSGSLDISFTVGD